MLTYEQNRLLKFLISYNAEYGIMPSYQELMAEMRAAIAEGRFDAWEAQFHATRAMGDIEPL